MTAGATPLWRRAAWTATVIVIGALGGAFLLLASALVAVLAGVDVATIEATTTVAWAIRIAMVIGFATFAVNVGEPVASRLWSPDHGERGRIV